MDAARAAAGFGALAQETRLAILRHLVRRGEAGAAAGEIAAALGLAPSLLSFHLGALERAGLVASTRVSRRILYRADWTGLGALAGFLLGECCAFDPRIVACCAPRT